LPANRPGAARRHYAALKTGSAQPLPIASKPLQSNYR